MLERLRLIFHTEANSALDRLEDPKKSLDYSLTRLEENLRQTRQSLVEIVTSQRSLQARRDQAAAAADHYDGQARLALERGREDLARVALERKQNARLREQELDNTAANLDTQVQALQTTLLGLQTRIELFRSKKEELKAIYDSSRAQLKVRESLTGLSADLEDVGQAIARAEERIQRMQARAGAIDQLVANGTVADPLGPAADDVDRELARLDRSATVELELANLKQEVGLLSDGRETTEPNH